jgi:hypothetical protein
MLMPVSDDHALRQFEIEALRQITDNLRRLNDGQTKIVDSLHSMDARLIRIESASVSAEVAELKGKVEVLEKDHHHRLGAKGFAEWMLRYGPTLAGFLILIVVVLKANGKL